MNIRSFIKGATTFVGSMAVGTLVTLGVNQNIIPGNKYEKIMIGIGKFILSDMISMKADEFVGNQIDKAFDLIDDFRGEPVKEIKHIDVEEEEEE